MGDKIHLKICAHLLTGAARALYIDQQRLVDWFQLPLTPAPTSG
jgi:hypothetical protein